MQRLFSLLFLGILAFSASASEGLISVRSNSGVSDTADRLEAVLKSKGMNVFARIDHAAGAKSAGLALPPTELVVFGNPKVGTPLMQCSRTTAIDLPQKALIWQDAEGVTWVSYNDPKYLQARHAIQGCDDALQKVSKALAAFAAAAAGQ